MARVILNNLPAISGTFYKIAFCFGDNLKQYT
jgi:hypothetical protein